MSRYCNPLLADHHAMVVRGFHALVHTSRLNMFSSLSVPASLHAHGGDMCHLTSSTCPYWHPGPG